MEYSGSRCWRRRDQMVSDARRSPGDPRCRVTTGSFGTLPIACWRAIRTPHAPCVKVHTSRVELTHTQRGDALVAWGVSAALPGVAQCHVQFDVSS